MRKHYLEVWFWTGAETFYLIWKQLALVGTTFRVEGAAQMRKQVTDLLASHAE